MKHAILILAHKDFGQVRHLIEYIEGPHKVSHHCADFEKINVLDVSKNSLSNVAAFKNAVKEAGFSPVLDENGCIHIELKFQ